MGYSCTKEAGLVLDKINKACIKQTGISNTWKHKNIVYFYEIGREHPDGHVTCQVWKMVGNYYCVKSGSIYIDEYGVIKRIPSHLKRLLKEELYDK